MQQASTLATADLATANALLRTRVAELEAIIDRQRRQIDALTAQLAAPIAPLPRVGEG